TPSAPTPAPCLAPRPKTPRRTGSHPAVGIDARSRTGHTAGTPQYRHVAVHRLAQPSPSTSIPRGWRRSSYARHRSSTPHVDDAIIAGGVAEPTGATRPSHRPGVTAGCISVIAQVHRRVATPNVEEPRWPTISDNPTNRPTISGNSGQNALGGRPATNVRGDAAANYRW